MLQRLDRNSGSDERDPSTLELPQPRWLQEIGVGLSVRSQFIVSGNIRDVYPIQASRPVEFRPIADAIWSVLRQKGYDGLLVHDPVEGARLHDGSDPKLESVLAKLGVSFGTAPRDLDDLATQLRLICSINDPSVAVVLDYASHLIESTQNLKREERNFFVACDKIAHSASLARSTSGDGAPPYNPIIWLLDHPADLPDWFALGNESIRSLRASSPNLEERFVAAHGCARKFFDSAELPAETRTKLFQQFALETEGMTLRSVMAIAEMARVEGFSLHNVSDAIKAYEIGTPDSPWRSKVMQARIAGGEAMLSRRVKGQDHAVRKSLDILIRSVMGLSGSQTSSRHGRPRGVLFFAGPTGVGKTELAKAITELLFGDELAYHRFDMSEFSSENSEARLIGAPPGYVGHEAGGELVNAARSRPFSVFLFDEIEKAHPRIYDKFLQIIDEGRLTDGRGETVHFSESLIIFTSNLGILGTQKSDNSGLNVLPSDSYDALEAKVAAAIRDHFSFELKRPELVSRIGQNIVVFDFITGRTPALILQTMLNKICAAVSDEHGVDISFSEEALSVLEDLCTHDLFNGGRGIGNRVESTLINPLSRLLFERTDKSQDKLRITQIVHEDGNVKSICVSPSEATTCENH